MDRQFILNEIKRTAKENGDTPLGIERFYAGTGIRRTDWFGKYWARWGDALLEAGYNPNTMQGAYEDERVVEELVALIRELGRFPSPGDIRLKARRTEGFPSHNVFSRVGKKAELVAKAIEFCSRKGGLEDVLEICRAVSVPRNQDPEHTPSAPSELGFVYLMKSGKYYKIGRTIALGRREYELGIQLPDKIATIHTIKTDDPAGIEAYWHKRFQDRRKNGEWFELTADDVTAFKRRKFM